MNKSAKQYELDELDRKTLMLLQENGRLSNVDLSRQLNLSPPTTHGRVRRLEEQGYITGYTAILDHTKIGYDMICFINVRLQAYQQEQTGDFRNDIIAMSEVVECYQVTGEYDYLLKVAVKDQRALEQFVVDRLTPLPWVNRVHTSLVLTEVKATTAYTL